MEYNNIRAKDTKKIMKKSKKQISSYDIYLKDYNLINYILIFNALMLIFGYFGE